ncbi:MAG: orotidine-5'-phosphate decarboxylase [Actinomycetaceae bacterium]|nr:orotidine-5'-phosphate decarboxylase [Actinomycetaceae bacterium]
MMFGTRLHRAMQEKEPVCAGIDPHPHLLSLWKLPDSIDGLREFSFRALEGLESAAAIKPQSAFFERFGAAGISVLEELLSQARERGVLTILDVKRGDIGSTMDGYAKSYLIPGAPLEADAITISPYMGPKAYEKTAQIAVENNKGLFILVLTSNPEGHLLQRSLDRSGRTVAGQVLEWAQTMNDQLCEQAHTGSFGAVIGATVTDPQASLGESLSRFTGPILAPGFGAQGGNIEQVKACFGPHLSRFLVSSSRSILQAGPNKFDLEEAVKKTANEVARAMQ